MKAILSLALALGACGLAGAADDKSADPAGTAIGGLRDGHSYYVRIQPDGTVACAAREDG